MAVFKGPTVKCPRSPAVDWSQAHVNKMFSQCLNRQRCGNKMNSGGHIKMSPEPCAIKRENPRRKILLTAVKLQISSPARLMQEKKKKKIYQGCNVLLSQAELDVNMVNKENKIGWSVSQQKSHHYCSSRRNCNESHRCIIGDNRPSKGGTHVFLFQCQLCYAGSLSAP